MICLDEHLVSKPDWLNFHLRHTRPSANLLHGISGKMVEDVCRRMTLRSISCCHRKLRRYVKRA